MLIPMRLLLCNVCFAFSWPLSYIRALQTLTTDCSGFGTSCRSSGTNPIEPFVLNPCARQLASCTDGHFCSQLPASLANRQPCPNIKTKSKPLRPPSESYYSSSSNWGGQGLA
ncbi:hypothetical protein V8C26DRAFT_389689 [Trichoderma gracile]